MNDVFDCKGKKPTKEMFDEALRQYYQSSIIPLNYIDYVWIFLRRKFGK